MTRIVAYGTVRRASALCQLTLTDGVLLVRITVIALVVELAIRVLTLPTVARLARVSLGNPAVALDRAAPRFSRGEIRAVRAARRVMRHWPWGGGTCLRRSLLMGYLLRRHNPTLRLGVKRHDAGILAHAWLDIPGVVGPGVGDYHAFDL